jgi:hypothetical protein
MTEEPKAAIRQRTFLKGTLYYNNRRASIACVVRDMSDSGARLTFEHPATVPDNVELFIPNKNQTIRARVQRRGSNEIGIAFEIERSLEPRRISDAELQQRVETLETEIAALKRLVAKLKAKVLPQDLDVA